MSRRYSFYYAASAYLLYLVYGMVADIKNGVSENTAVSVAAAIFFAVAAGGIAWYAWRGSKAEKLAAEKAAREEREKAIAESEAAESEETAALSSADTPEPPDTSAKT